MVRVAGWIVSGLGLAFTALFVFGWVDLILKHEAVDAVRVAFAHWPSITAMMVTVALAIVCSVVGVRLLSQD
jgi:hypothetical protein